MVRLLIRQAKYKLHVQHFRFSFSLRDLLICQNLFTEYWDDSDVPYEFGDYHYSSDFSTFIYADIPAIGAESDSCSLFCA